MSSKQVSPYLLMWKSLEIPKNNSFVIFDD